MLDKPGLNAEDLAQVLHECLVNGYESEEEVRQVYEQYESIQFFTTMFYLIRKGAIK